MKKSQIPTLVVTAVVALGILVAMGVLCFKVGRPESTDYVINMATLLTSVAVGWLFGTFLSPDSPDEDTRFSRYGVAIKSFASGYLVSKIDKLVTTILDPSSLLQDLPAFRFLVCIAGVVVAMMATFVLRQYVLEGADAGDSGAQTT